MATAGNRQTFAKRLPQEGANSTPKINSFMENRANSKENHKLSFQW